MMRKLLRDLVQFIGNIKNLKLASVGRISNLITINLLVVVAGILSLMSPVSLAAGDDTPSPAQHLETIPAGSWIIAMDNANQGISGVMNVKAYGLAVEMLWANVPLKWVIKSGKAKDDIDIKLNTTQIIPTLTADPAVTTPTQNWDGTATWGYTGTGGSNATVGKFNGTRSWRLATTNVLTMNNIDISSLSNVKIKVAFASALVDPGDNLLMDFSYDNGITWTADGTGSVKLVTPTANNTSLNINTTAAYTVSANPYTFDVPSTAYQVMVRFRSSTTLGTNEYYFVDDIQLTSDGTYKHAFVSGPLIILPSDTAAARTVVNAYNSPLAAAEKIKIYKTDEAITADVRYTLTHRPNIAVFDDGGNSAIHVGYLTSAGIGATRYQVLASGTAIDTLNCFTLASEPHWDHVGKAYTRNDSMRVNNLRFFLETGGNFLAQCIAVQAFEEFKPNNFQTTTGFLELGVEGADPNLKYVNGDLPIMQTNGAFNNDGGSLDSWTLNKSGAWKSPAYKGVYFLQDVMDAAGAAGTDGVLDTVVHISSTKIVPSTEIGGNLTYLSGHNYSGTTIDQINGRRIYLNNILIPSIRTLAKGSAYASSPLICEKDTLRLYVSPPSGTTYTYAWIGPDGFSSTLQNPVVPNFSDLKAGEYRVTLTTSSGCKFTYPVVAVALAPKIGSVNATAALSGCIGVDGYQGVLSAPIPLSGNGVWSIVSGPGTLGSTSSNPASITGLSTTGSSTTVKWKVTTSNGCKDSSSTTFTPPLLDTAYVSKYDTSFCLSCAVKNGDTYYFIDPTGKILCGITDVSADMISIGTTEFCARLTYSLPGNPSVTDVPTISTNSGQQPYMSRYWSVHAGTEAKMTVRLFFTDEELSSIIGKSVGTNFEFSNVYGMNVSIYPDNGSTFTPAGSANGYTIVPTYLRRGGFWEVTFQVPGSSTFYLHPSPGGTPLPIELLTFRAVPDNNIILTSWSTASEQNNDYFTVERSKDALHFEAVGEVDGAGNSSSVRNYSFTDTKPISGTSYYRLRQVDFDGTFSYSKIVPVNLVKSNFNLYPNPTHGIFNIDLMDMQGQSVSIKVYDNMSRLVYSDKVSVESERHSLSIDLKDYPAGMYTVICSTGNISRKKIITIQ